jgi:hypothetical protein
LEPFNTSYRTSAGLSESGMQSASGTMQASFAMLMVAFILALAAIAVNWGSGPVTMQGVTLPPEPKLSYAGPIYEGHGEWDYKVCQLQARAARLPWLMIESKPHFCS